MLTRLAATYGRANASRPIAVQSATAGVIASAGDVLMQLIEGHQREKPLDLSRTGRIAAFRLAIFGPSYSLWMRALERTVVVSSTARAVVFKTLLDQLVWTPPSLSLFYVTMARLEGQPLATGVDRARRMLWPTLRVNWPFWCCVHVLTFSVVPPALRMAWVSTVQVGWNAFVSGLNETARLRESAESEQASGGPQVMEDETGY